MVKLFLWISLSITKCKSFLSKYTHKSIVAYSDSSIATSHLYSVCANKHRYASCRTTRDKGVGLIVLHAHEGNLCTCDAYLFDCLWRTVSDRYINFNWLTMIVSLKNKWYNWPYTHVHVHVHMDTHTHHTHDTVCYI